MASYSLEKASLEKRQDRDEEVCKPSEGGLAVAAPADANDKKLLRKIDMRLVPWLSFLYLLSFLDRSAIGNAKIYGLEADIGASDQEYLWGLTLFFFPYALAEVPSNILIKRLRPSIWIPAIMVVWGVCMACQGVIENPGGLYVARFFLGLAEAGLFPGVQYYLSCWYLRREFGLRSALFFAAATAAGAFGGLLAAALAQMDGIGGYEGWRWIFIIEGILTFVVGIAAFWLCYDWPDTATFLTPAERARVVERLREDGQWSAAGEKFDWRCLGQAFGDLKMWLGAAIYMGCDGPLYAFSLFAPTIVQNLGFQSPTTANLVSAPIYVWACMVTVVVGFAADRTGGRGYYNLVFLAVGAAGYIILVASRNFALSYFATYLAASGIYPLIANTIAWVSNNAEGTYKRSVVMACVISWGNLNGAVSSNIYRSKEKPWYRLGHGLVLMYICIGWVASAALLCVLKRENQLRDAGERDEAIGGERLAPGQLNNEGKGKGGWFTTVEEAQRFKGDKWSGYRYQY